MEPKSTTQRNLGLIIKRNLIQGSQTEVRSPVKESGTEKGRKFSYSVRKSFGEIYSHEKEFDHLIFKKDPINHTNLHQTSKNEIVSQIKGKDNRVKESLDVHMEKNKNVDMNSSWNITSYRGDGKVNLSVQSTSAVVKTGNTLSVIMDQPNKVNVAGNCFTKKSAAIDVELDKPSDEDKGKEIRIDIKDSSNSSYSGSHRGGEDGEQVKESSNTQRADNSHKSAKNSKYEAELDSSNFEKGLKTDNRESNKLKANDDLKIEIPNIQKNGEKDFASSGDNLESHTDLGLKQVFSKKTKEVGSKKDMKFLDKTKMKQDSNTGAMNLKSIIKQRKDQLKSSKSRDKKSERNECTEDQSRGNKSERNESTVDKIRDNKSERNESTVDKIRDNKSQRNESTVDKIRDNKSERNESTVDKIRHSKSERNESTVDKSRDNKSERNESSTVDKIRDNKSERNESTVNKIKDTKAERNESILDKSRDNKSERNESTVDKSRDNKSERNESTVDKSRDNKSERNESTVNKIKNTKSERNESSLDKRRDDKSERNECTVEKCRDNKSERNESILDKSRQNKLERIESTIIKIRDNKSERNESTVDKIRDNKSERNESTVDKIRDNKSERNESIINKIRENKSERNESTVNKIRENKSERNESTLDKSRDNKSEKNESIKNKIRDNKSERNESTVDKSRDNKSERNESTVNKNRENKSEKNESILDKDRDNLLERNERSLDKRFRNNQSERNESTSDKSTNEKIPKFTFKGKDHINSKKLGNKKLENVENGNVSEDQNIHTDLDNKQTEKKRETEVSPALVKKDLNSDNGTLLQSDKKFKNKVNGPSNLKMQSKEFDEKNESNFPKIHHKKDNSVPAKNEKLRQNVIEVESGTSKGDTQILETISLSKSGEPHVQEKLSDKNIIQNHQKMAINNHLVEKIAKEENKSGGDDLHTGESVLVVSRKSQMICDEREKAFSVEASADTLQQNNLNTKSDIMENPNKPNLKMKHTLQEGGVSTDDKVNSLLNETKSFEGSQTKIKNKTNMSSALGNVVQKLNKIDLDNNQTKQNAPKKKLGFLAAVSAREKFEKFDDRVSKGQLNDRKPFLKTIGDKNTKVHGSLNSNVLKAKESMKTLSEDLKLPKNMEAKSVIGNDVKSNESVILKDTLHAQKDLLKKQDNSKGKHVTDHISYTSTSEKSNSVSKISETKENLKNTGEFGTKSELTVQNTFPENSEKSETKEIVADIKTNTSMEKFIQQNGSSDVGMLSKLDSSSMMERSSNSELSLVTSSLPQSESELNLKSESSISHVSTSHSKSNFIIKPVSQHIISEPMDKPSSKQKPLLAKSVTSSPQETKDRQRTSHSQFPIDQCHIITQNSDSPQSKIANVDKGKETGSVLQKETSTEKSAASTQSTGVITELGKMKPKSSVLLQKDTVDDKSDLSKHETTARDANSILVKKTIPEKYLRENDSTSDKANSTKPSDKNVEKQEIDQDYTAEKPSVINFKQKRDDLKQSTTIQKKITEKLTLSNQQDVEIKNTKTTEEKLNSSQHEKPTNSSQQNVSTILKSDLIQKKDLSCEKSSLSTQNDSPSEKPSSSLQNDSAERKLDSFLHDDSTIQKPSTFQEDEVRKPTVEKPDLPQQKNTAISMQSKQNVSATGTPTSTKQEMTIENPALKNTSSSKHNDLTNKKPSSLHNDKKIQKPNQNLPQDIKPVSESTSIANKEDSVEKKDVCKSSIKNQLEVINIDSKDTSQTKLTDQTTSNQTDTSSDNVSKKMTLKQNVEPVSPEAHDIPPKHNILKNGTKSKNEDKSKSLGPKSASIQNDSKLEWITKMLNKKTKGSKSKGEMMSLKGNLKPIKTKKNDPAKGLAVESEENDSTLKGNYLSEKHQENEKVSGSQPCLQQKKVHFETENKNSNRKSIEIANDKKQATSDVHKKEITDLNNVEPDTCVSVVTNGDHFNEIKKKETIESSYSKTFHEVNSVESMCNSSESEVKNEKEDINKPEQEKVSVNKPEQEKVSVNKVSAGLTKEEVDLDISSSKGKSKLTPHEILKQNVETKNTPKTGVTLEKSEISDKTTKAVENEEKKNALQAGLESSDLKLNYRGFLDKKKKNLAEDTENTPKSHVNKKSEKTDNSVKVYKNEGKKSHSLQAAFESGEMKLKDRDILDEKKEKEVESINFLDDEAEKSSAEIKVTGIGKKDSLSSKLRSIFHSAQSKDIKIVDQQSDSAVNEKQSKDVKNLLSNKHHDTDEDQHTYEKNMPESNFSTELSDGLKNGQSEADIDKCFDSPDSLSKEKPNAEDSVESSGSSNSLVDIYNVTAKDTSIPFHNIVSQRDEDKTMSDVASNGKASILDQDNILKTSSDSSIFLGEEKGNRRSDSFPKNRYIQLEENVRQSSEKDDNLSPNTKLLSSLMSLYDKSSMEPKAMNSVDLKMASAFDSDQIGDICFVNTSFIGNDNEDSSSLLESKYGKNVDDIGLEPSSGQYDQNAVEDILEKKMEDDDDEDIRAELKEILPIEFLNRNRVSRRRTTSPVNGFCVEEEEQHQSCDCCECQDSSEDESSLDGRIPPLSIIKEEDEETASVMDDAKNDSPELEFHRQFMQKVYSRNAKAVKVFNPGFTNDVNDEEEDTEDDEEEEDEVFDVSKPRKRLFDVDAFLNYRGGVEEWLEKIDNHVPMTREPSKAYEYKVFEQDFSVPSRSYIDHLTTYIPPRLPIEKPEMYQISPESVTLTWKKARVPDKIRDKCNLTYTVEVRNPPQLDWRELVTGLTSTNCDLKGLHPRLDYLFRIRALNEYGCSEPSLPVSLHRPIEISDEDSDEEVKWDEQYRVTLGDLAPPKLPMETPKIVDSGVSAMLSWLPARIPAYAKKTPITYIIEIKEPHIPGWSRLASGINDTNYFIEDLRPTQDYQFRVKAETQYGVSDPTLPASLDRPKDHSKRSEFLPDLEYYEIFKRDWECHEEYTDKNKRPSIDLLKEDLELEMTPKRELQSSGVPPRIPSSRPLISHQYEDHLTLSWMPARVPSYVKNQKLYYIVEVREPPSTLWRPLVDNLLETEFDVTNLTPDQDYLFRVKAKNEFGVSEPTMPATVIRDRDDYIPNISSRSGSFDSGSPWVRSRASSVESLRKQKSFDLTDDDSDIYINREKKGCPPEFKQSNEDVHFGVEGKSCKVSLAIRGYPLPSTSWFFLGTQVDYGDAYRAHISPSGIATLDIGTLTKDLVGEYKCCAENEHGSATKIITVELADQPTILEPMTDLTVDSHSSGKLVCHVDGLPCPTVKFLKDQRPLAGSSRMKIDHQPPDRWTLVFDKCITTDSGLYTCMAENMAGKATCSAKLTVEDRDLIVKPLPYREAYVEDYYYILEEIGRGRHGIVRRVLDKVTGCQYAAKFLHVCDEHEKSFFRKEVNILRWLKQKGVPKLVDAFVTERRLVIITELVSEVDIIDKILQQSSPTEGLAASYIKQILHIAKELHKSSVLHLDIKPSNVRFSNTNPNDLNLIDFGFSERIQKTKELRISYGSPGFSAPEVINHEPVTAKTDVWSIGVLAYVLLTGTSPFPGTTDQEILIKSQNCDWKFINDESMSADAKDFITKILVKDPSKRFSVDDCLSHPWIMTSDNIGISGYLNTTLLASLQSHYKNLAKSTATRETVRLTSLASLLENTKDDSGIDVHRDQTTGELSFPDSNSYGEYLDQESWFDWQSRYYYGLDMYDSESDAESVHGDPVLRKEREWLRMAEDEKMHLQRPQDFFPKEEEEEENPQFTIKLHDTHFKPGDTIVLSCHVIGNSSLSVSWFHDEELVSDDKRVSSSFSGDGIATLTIKSSKPYDDGIYKCTVRSKTGKSSTYARVLVGEIPPQPGRPVVSQISSHDVLLLWETPETDGNLDILNFRVDYRKSGSDKWCYGAYTIDDCALVTGLDADTLYRFRVSCHNKLGDSPYSVSSKETKTLPEGANDLALDPFTLTQLSKQHESLSFYQPPKSKLSLEDVKRREVTLQESPVEEIYSFSNILWRGRFSQFVRSTEKSSKDTFIAKITKCDDSNREILTQELNLLRTLQHEKLIYLYGAYFYQSNMYWILEYLSGVNVVEHFSYKNKYSEDMVATVMRQVLDGLQYLHHLGYAHLNVQPDSIMMVNRRSLDVRIVDFSLARKLSREGEVVAKEGNREFLAPEVVVKEKASFSADIWSLGVLTFLLLSGESPYKGTDADQTFTNIAYNRYNALSLYENITKEALKFIFRILKRVPRNRMTADECLEDKWLQCTDTMVKNRNNAVFSTAKLRNYVRESLQQSLDELVIDLEHLRQKFIIRQEPVTKAPKVDKKSAVETRDLETKTQESSDNKESVQEVEPDKAEKLSAEGTVIDDSGIEALNDMADDVVNRAIDEALQVQNTDH